MSGTSDRGGAMQGWTNQRGDVPVGCLIGFAVMVVVAIIAMNAIPAQLELGEFEKRIEELADRANRRVRIRVHFVQEVDFPGYTWVRQHDIRLERPVF
jgi:hypothetical protein